MRVFSWETSVATFFARLPHDDIAFRLMHFISYPGFFGWLLWLGLFVFIFREKLKETVTPFFLGLISSGLGDLSSRRVVKVAFMRPRPWANVESCFSADCWGFVSSHATNITAFVTVFSLYDRRNLIWGVPTVFLVSMSRIYIGDHYGLDVLGGVLLGSAIGSLVWLLYLAFRVFNQSIKKLRSKDAPMA